MLASVKFEKNRANVERVASPRRVILLGSTGSIGLSTLEVVRRHPDRFTVSCLVAGSNWQRLLEQAAEFRPDVLGIASEEAASRIREHWSGELVVGQEQIAALAAEAQSDVIVASIVGLGGIQAVVSAVAAGKYLALANKECLVAAGRIIANAAARSGAQIVPVDSEHSAIFQALAGEHRADISRLILTASGGPFRDLTLKQMESVSVEQALKHPNWSMGAKISIDSASMVNKALELIECCWLFDIEAEHVDVLVHPQSIIHSIVEFRDGIQIAQASVPDMKGAIAYALNFPNGRLKDIVEPLDLAQLSRLDFKRLDDQRFPAINLARQALKQGGSAPAVFTMLNDIAVKLFLDRKIGFLEIVEFIQRGLELDWPRDYSSLQDLLTLQDEINSKIG